MTSSRAAAVVLAFLISAGGALAPAFAADPPSPRRLTKGELKRYRAVMAEAMRAADKGNHAAAIAAFDRALAIKPNDPAALTEQGWSAFQMHALDRAEAITRRAIATEGDERRMAAACYNLGRILEERGDRAGAIAAYVDSLEHRPTRTVRDQLAKLDPAKAAEADPLKPLPMLGPFARLEDFCKVPQLGIAPPCPSSSGVRAKDVPKPYKDVVWIDVLVHGIGPSCFVAFQLEQGWFVDPNGDGCEKSNDHSWTAVDFRVTDLVPGGNPEVVFRTDSAVPIEDPDHEGPVERVDRWTYQETKSRLLVCGVPAKGTPKCLYLPTAKALWHLEPVFSADGQVEVKGTGTLDDEARLYLGRRPLAFP